MLKWLLRRFSTPIRNISLPVERPDLKNVQWARLPHLVVLRERLESRFAALPPVDDPVEISATAVFQLYGETALFVLGKASEPYAESKAVDAAENWTRALQSVLVGLSYASVPHYAKAHALKTVERLAHLFDWEAEVWMLGLAVRLQRQLDGSPHATLKTETPTEEMSEDLLYRTCVVDFMLNEVGKLLPPFEDIFRRQTLKTFTWCGCQH
jgi:hypothetical protein